MIFERLGGVGAYVCARASVPPAVVTGFSCLTGIVGALLLAHASAPAHVLFAGLMLLVSYTLDCVDGQLARSTGQATERGAWLDVIADAIVVAFVSVSLAYALIDDASGALPALLVSGAYGAARTVSLLTAAIVIRNSTGMRLDGTWGALRTVYVAATDTPVAYVALCSARLWPNALTTVVMIYAALTLLQTAVSADNYFKRPMQTPVPAAKEQVTP